MWAGMCLSKHAIQQACIIISLSCMPCPTGEGQAVQPVCSLHILERLLHVMSHAPFVDLLVALLCPDPSHVLEASSSPSQQETRAASGGLASTSHPSSASSAQARLPSLVRDGPIGGSSSLAEGQNEHSPVRERARSSGYGRAGQFAEMSHCLQ